MALPIAVTTAPQVKPAPNAASRHITLASDHGLAQQPAPLAEGQRQWERRRRGVAVDR